MWVGGWVPLVVGVGVGLLMCMHVGRGEVIGWGEQACPSPAVVVRVHVGMHTCLHTLPVCVRALYTGAK